MGVLADELSPLVRRALKQTETFISEAGCTLLLSHDVDLRKFLLLSDGIHALVRLLVRLDLRS